MGELLQQSRVNWKTHVHRLNCIRILLATWRGEKWIKYIWKNTNVYWNTIIQSSFLKYTVYLIFNTDTKRMIVGSTTRTIYDRLQSHLRGKADNLSKKAAHYILQRGPSNWICLPLESLPIQQHNKKLLEEAEGKWARIFNDYLINNPIQKNTYRPTQRPDYRDRTRQRCAMQRTQVTQWRSYIYTINHTTIWHTWHELALINILTNIKRARLTEEATRKTTYKIRHYLKHKRGLPLRPYYELTLIPHPHLDTQKIKQWIKRILLRHHPQNAYYTYVAHHLKVTVRKQKSIAQIVANYKKTLQQYHHDVTLPEICPCQQYQELIAQNRQHVHIKACHLPSSWSRIRRILTLSSKNPLMPRAREYLGIQYRHLRIFLAKNQLPTTWDLGQNEILYQIFLPTIHYTPLLDMEMVRKDIVPLQQHLCFLPLDKNNGTWTITCQQWYLYQVAQHFNDRIHYQDMSDTPTILRYKIRDAYRNNIEMKHGVTQPKARPRQKWRLGEAYLLPKNKDIYRFRPIISYYHFLSKPYADKIARALAVTIKELTKLIPTMEIYQTKLLKIKLQKLKHNDIWEEAFSTNSLTFFHFDIKNQFTNLNKHRVLQNLLYSIDLLRHNRTATGKLNFAIRRRRYEKSRDRIGNANPFHEVSISANDIWRYCGFELQYPCFIINNTIMKQKQGLPMGGFLSAPLACIDAMIQETLFFHHWHQNILRYSLCTRFRDDILVIIPYRANAQETTDIQQRLSEIYRPDLTIELEETTHNQIHFLEYQIAFTTMGFNTTHYSRNQITTLGTDHQIIRYPHPHAAYSKSIFIGTIIGMIKRARNACSNLENFIPSLVNILTEFLYLGYPFKWIGAAISRSNLPLQITLILNHTLQRILT